MTDSNNPSKTLLVGIDAACWEYLDPLIDAGRLPNITSLLENGSHGTLRSVMPPITPAAWSSIVTGVNPGKHNVFEWVRRQRDSYQMLPVDTSQRIGTPIWKRLNQSGIRVGVVNIPLTHPVEHVDGFMLCGFSAPYSSRNLTFPPSALEELESEFGPYLPDIDRGIPDASRAGSYAQEREFQARQVRIACWLARRYEVQILIMNLMLLDHANHTQKDMSVVEQAICDTDKDLGVLLEDFAPDNVLLISDHGSRRVKGVFLLQAWLAEKGYVSLQPRPIRERSPIINFLISQKEGHRDREIAAFDRAARRLKREAMLYLPKLLVGNFYDQLEQEIPLSNLQINFRNEFYPSKSFVYLPATLRGNLAINLMGREPNGIVQQAEADELVEKICEDLRDVLDPLTGNPLFSGLYRPNDIYSGDFTKNAPDITCDYYCSEWSMRSNLPGLYPRTARYFVTTEQWYGDHSPNGIYIFSGDYFQKNLERRHASITDIPATLLYVNNVPIPEDYDGAPLISTVHQHILTNQRVRTQAGDMRDFSEKSSDLSEMEQEDILQRLRDLGYVE